MKIAVLGAGMVGRVIAVDLASDSEVTTFDVSEHNLKLLREKNSSIQTQQADLTSFDQYQSWLSPFDIVITAVPGFIGFSALRSVINCRKNVVDISFFPEDVLQLDKLA